MAFKCCGGVTQNTGIPSKQFVISSGVKLVKVRMVADDGTPNSVASTDTINKAYVDALLQNADPSKRWYPIGTFENVDDVRADPTTETFNSGASAVTSQGVRTYTGWLLNYSPAYLKVLQSFSCEDFGFYVIDECGQLIGEQSKDCTELFPIRVNAASWNPTLIKFTPVAVGKVQVTFEYDQLVNDADLALVPESDIADDIDLRKITGLKQLKIVTSGISQTGWTANITVGDGSFGGIPAGGLVTASFQAFNETDQAAIAITSVTETGVDTGIYAFVIPSQDVSDVVNYSIDLTNGDGVDGEDTITIV